MQQRFEEQQVEELAEQVLARVRAHLERGVTYAKHAHHHAPGGLDPVSMPIQENGAALPRRPALNFGQGLVATDNVQASRTDVDADYGQQADIAAVDAGPASAGTLPRLARADHKHSANVATPVDLADSNQEGSASTLARSDHAHRRSVRVKSGTDNYVRNALNIIGLGVTDDALDDEIEIVHDASSPGHHVEVQDEGTAVAQRAVLNFVGGGVTVSDDAAGGRVNINIPGGGGGGTGTGGHEIQEDGTALPQRAGLNFAAGLVASDNQASDRTDVNLDYGAAADVLNADASASAPGSLSRVARADHRHGVSVAAPVDLGDANAEGSSSALARADHVHKRSVRVKSGTSDFSRNALNISGLGVADDATDDEVDIVHDASSPGHHAQAHDIDGADHTGTLDIGDAQLPAPPAGYAADVAAAGADGTSTRVARADHVHAHGTGYLPDAHHPRAHDHSAAADGDALSPAVLNLPQAASPAQTVEGQVVWDSTNDKLTVGDGTGRRVMAREDQAVMDGDAAGGELTGTYPNPAVATVHAGSAHHAQVHAVDGSDHTGTLDIGDAQLPAPPDGYPADVAAASADGTSARVARADHVHAHGTGYLPDAHHPQTHGDADHTGPSRVEVQDEGTTVGTRTVLNFTGTGVRATDNAQAGRVDIEIPGSATIQLLLDGGGSPITAGLKAYVEVPFDCTVTGWTVVADQTGSILIDVWRSTYAGFPPTSANSIAGTEKPRLNAQQKNQDLSLTSWSTSLARGDWLAFNVDAASGVTLVTVSLRVERA